ncbi:hypothetical protein NKV53_11600 [Legionella sp. 27cVA30]|uniref:hypothetical protein n=1 Tax=Legionella sp. 27cVA30 TaxID=2905657 RepID=UPI00209D3A03|nr:hypothetical protein [Legionella sp. 27cVA30]MCP0914969.1 hypothetical protein [Legionella sp. 27cVA30]
MTISKEAEVIEVIHSSSSRRRWVLYEKQQIVQETYQPACVPPCIPHKIQKKGHFCEWREMRKQGKNKTIYFKMNALKRMALKESDGFKNQKHVPNHTDLQAKNI